MKKACFYFSVILLACFIGTVSAKTLFQDDFEKGDFNKTWVIISGQWEVKKVDGNSVAAHSGSTGSETIAIKDMVFDDFIVEMKIKHVSDSAGAQIYWHTSEKVGNDAGEVYIFGEDASGNTIRWYRVAGGSPTLQTQIPNIDITPDTWTWFKVRTEGTQAKMWYKREGKDKDYILAFDIKDLAEYQKGAIGTWVGGDVLVDDVLVTDLLGADIEPSGKLASMWGRIKNEH